jgi:multicomponent Na+:H+ antiporter subunit D
MDYGWFLLVPVLLPILAGILCYSAKTDRQLSALTGSVLILSLPLALLAVLLPAPALTVWRMTDTIAVFLRPDDVSRVFLCLVVTVFLGVGIYSIGYMAHGSHRRRFYCFFLVTMGALEGLSLSGNIITFYLFYEMVTLSTLPLVMHEMTKEAVAAGIKYLIYSVIGASAALLGIFFIGAYGTTFDFTAGGVLDAAKAAGHSGLLTAMMFTMIMGFCVKAGVFPMHAWLPTAHPIAPSPASALLSGLVTKAGVLGILRVMYYLAGAASLRGTWAQTALMALSLLTVLLGSTMALKETVLKRRLAYSTVSQISYIVFGLSTMTEAGFIGAILHVICHSLIKDTLFMGAGSIIQRTGKTDVRDMHGIGAAMPVTTLCFTAVSLGLIGIPPTGGFISKWQLAQGALSLTGAVSWIGPACLLLSALLTAGYLMTVVIHGYFPDGEPAAAPKVETTPLMWAPMAGFALLSVLVGLFPNTLISFIRHIAAGIL